MTAQFYLLAMIGAAVVAALAFLLSGQAAQQRWLLDPVTERSSHSVPASRLGGVCFLIPIFLGFWIVSAFADFALALPWSSLIVFTAIAAALGFMDDIKPLHPLLKLGLQFILAIMTVYVVGPVQHLSVPLMGFTVIPIWLGYILCVMWIVGFMNVYNFMDGLNGMAAGSGLVVTLFLSALGVWLALPGLFVISLLLAAGLGGFLPVNLTGKSGYKIFMGDAGSLGSGYLFAALGLAATQAKPEAFSLYVVPLLFLPFIMDVFITLILRARRGEKLYQAHKEHLYQRLHQSGLSHGKVSFLYAMVIIFCGIASFIMLNLDLSFMWIVPLGGIIILMFMAWRVLTYRAQADRKTE